MLLCRSMIVLALSHSFHFILYIDCLAPQDLQRKPSGLARLLASISPKNPIQSMYEEFEAQGITPGEEVC